MALAARLARSAAQLAPSLCAVAFGTLTGVAHLARIRQLGVFALVLLCAASAAYGQAVQPLGGGAPELAEQRYVIGYELYRKGKFAEAASEFQTGLDLFPNSSRLAFNLARALERAGRPKDAITAYERYLALAPQAADAPQVRVVVDSLRRRVASARSALRIYSEPAGAEILVDGAVVGPAPVTHTLPPGPHGIIARLPGYSDAAQSVDLPSGEEATLTLTLARIAAPPPAPSERTPRVLGWTLLGLGAAALGVGVWQAAEAAGARSDVEGLPAGARDRYAALSDDYESSRLWAGVGLGVGAALGGVGGWLVWRPDAAGATAALSPSGLTWRSSF
jgi:tetratricopeptide (TPR) repeat protein